MLLLTGLKEAPRVILVFFVMVLVCWLHALTSLADSFRNRPPPKAGPYIKYFLVFYVSIVCLFGIRYYAAGMMGHNVFDKGESLVCAVDSKVQTELDTGQIPEIMRQRFESMHILLGENATVSSEVPSSKWMIIDGKHTYIVTKEDGRLNVHKRYIRSPGDLIYFSVITATTLGYGDLFPCDWITKALSILEVSFGVIFIMAVVTVALAFRPVPSQIGR
jgi:hypothetical protein